MKRTIEISASFTGTIPTGSYENEKPFYSVKEIIEYDEGKIVLDLQLENRQKELHDICYKQFKRQADISYTERIAKEYQNIRFYDFDGKKVPSVTSIIGVDKDFNIPQDELTQYGSRGTLIHKQVEIFLTTGEWKSPKDIEECSFDYLTVINGNLELDFENVDFRAFYKDYPFDIVSLEHTTINESYGGRIDIIAIINSTKKGKWEKIDGVVFDEPIILDIKTATTLDKMSGLTQQAAYAKSEDIKHIGLIHLTKDNKCGFAKPIVTNNVERYWNLFINKRDKFKQRYGI